MARVRSLEVREQSLLGSSTMLRVLAGAHHSMAVDLSDERHAHVTTAGDARARQLFSAMSGHMGYPVAPEWLATDVFPTKDAKAPSSRAQDLKALTTAIAGWGEGQSPFEV